MGTLINCRVCNHQVSSTASFCPHCGDRSPVPMKDNLKYGLSGFMIIGIIILIIVGLINYLFY
ncbi:zinc-ribbon domain-containing protein [Paenibacillus sp. strain BS8-2]